MPSKGKAKGEQDLMQMIPTDEIQTHHMSTHRSHLKAYSLALEAAGVFMN